jgi:hypothetical protein
MRSFAILFTTVFFNMCEPAWNPVDELRYVRPSQSLCVALWRLEGRFDAAMPEIMTACQRCFVRPAQTDEDDEYEDNTDAVDQDQNPKRRA